MRIETIKENENIVDKKLVSVSQSDLKDGYKLKVPEGVTIIGSDIFDEIVSEVPIKIKLPNTVNKIEDNAFSGANISKIKFPNSLDSLAEKAFIGCTFEERVVLPDSLEKLPESCFMNCKFVNGITLPSKLKEISPYLFCGAELGDIDIPDGVTKIENDAFRESIVTKLKMSDALCFIGDRAFQNTKNINTVHMPKNVVFIGSAAFSGSEIGAISFNEGLVYIGDNCFSNTNLEFIFKLPSTLKYIGNSAFYDTKIETVSLPENMEYVGKSAFANCPIRNLEVNEDVVLGTRAFADNQNLSTVMMSDFKFWEISKNPNSIFSGVNENVSFVLYKSKHAVDFYIDGYENDDIIYSDKKIKKQTKKIIRDDIRKWF